MQKELENTGRTDEILNNLKKERIKTGLSIAIIIVVLAIIIFIGISYYTYKSPKAQLQLGAEIEKVTISSEGNMAYVKLRGGSNLYNITKVKFTFTDKGGNNYLYDTTEGIKEIDIPYKRTFWDFILGFFGKKPEYLGTYNYNVSSDEIGINDFYSIKDVSVLFEYVTERGVPANTTILDTTKLVNKTTTGGGRGGSNKNNNPPASCTPKTCADYAGYCGVSLDNGCSGTLTCGCESGYYCSGGSCIEQEKPVNCSEVSCFYVSSAGSGSKNGSDWNNACTGLPASLQRGATYYIADGNYSGYTFDDPENGTQYITIKKATANEHGTDAGWNNNYGDGQAEFTRSGESVFVFKRGYFIINGSIGGWPENWRDGYGFKLKGTNANQSIIDLRGPASWWVPPLPSFVTLSHIEFEHRGLNTWSRDGGILSNIANSTYYDTGLGSNNITISYCYFHNISRFPVVTSETSGWLFEYNYVTEQSSSSGQCDDDNDGDNFGFCRHLFFGETIPRECNLSTKVGNPLCPNFHGTPWEDFGSDNVIVRYNLWENGQGTGILDLKRNYPQSNENWSVYGNVFYYTPNYNQDGISFLFGITTENNNPANNMLFYNNIIIHAPGWDSGVNFPYGTGNKVYNNIWYNCSRYTPGAGGDGSANVIFTNVDYNYNIYSNSALRSNPPAANDIVTTGDPFIDWQAMDFRLKNATSSGINFSWMNNKDMFGVIRGADGNWDRGAIEYVAAQICIGNCTNNITQYNITWTFDKQYQYGKFANGDYWVVGPVTIIKIEPESIIIDETGKNYCIPQNISNCTEIGGNKFCSNNVCHYNRTINGAMVNINSSIKQIGYDSAITSFLYNESLNVARKNNEPISDINPLQLPVSTSLVSSTSLNSSFYDFGVTQGSVLKSAAVLTVLDKVPASGSFRPAYCGSNKTIKFNEAQLNYGLLLNLDRKNYVNQTDLYLTETRFSRPWIDHLGGGMGDVVMPYENGNRYPGYRNQYEQEAAVLLNLDWSGSPNFTSNNQYKKDLLFGTVQVGIDLYGVYQSGTNANVGWGAGGGHGISRKFPIIFAGAVLDNSGADPEAKKMKNIAFEPGLNFAEDLQTFYVNQTTLDNQNRNYSSSNHCNPQRTIEWGDPQNICHSPECSGDSCGNLVGPDPRSIIIPYTSADFGLPEWKIDNDHSGRFNRAWVCYYRMVSQGHFPGVALGIRMMNLTHEWNHNEFLDYMDRYVEIEREVRQRLVNAGGGLQYGGCIYNYTTHVCEPGIYFNIPGTPDKDIRGNNVNEIHARHYAFSTAFVESIWNEYRSKYGCVWKYDNLTDINSKWHYDCTGCTSNCLRSPYCGDKICNGVENPGTCPWDCSSVSTNCTNGIQDGDETDIDCGGNCPQECISTQPFEADYYVDNLVNDCLTYNVSTRTCGNGNKQVFNTIQKGVNAVNPGDVLAVRGGRYHEEIVIKNSGNPDDYISYLAYPREKPILDGSVSLDNWTKCSSQAECLGNNNWEEIYYTDIPKYRYPYGAIVYEGNRISKIAMYPDQTDEFYIDQIDEFKTFTRLEGCPSDSIRDPDYLTSGNLPYWENSYVSMWQGSNEVVTRKINSFDSSQNKITFDDISCNYDENKYAIMNNIVALDRKGEFYIHNSSGQFKLYYWPYESINNVTYSDLTSGFNLEGNGNLRIEGFDIRKMSIGPGGGWLGGSAIINPSGGNNIIIKNNIIFGLQGSAIYLSYCSNCLIENNTIFNVYGTGIILSGSWSGNTYIYNSSVNKNHLNKIQSTAIDYYAAIDSNITNNIIANCYGTHGNGITVYENSTHVLVEGNKMYNVTYAITTNNGQYHIIRNNFADTPMYFWASPQSDYLVEQNTFLGGTVEQCSLPCLGVYKNFTIRNNIFGGGICIADSIKERGNNLYVSKIWCELPLQATDVYYPDINLLFVNPGKNDYRPVYTSPACNMSTNGSYVGVFPCVCTNDSQCSSLGLVDCDEASGICSGLHSFSPFTKLWNFLKGMLTTKTGNVILTGNAVKFFLDINNTKFFSF